VTPAPTSSGRWPDDVDFEPRSPPEEEGAVMEEGEEEDEEALPVVQEEEGERVEKEADEDEEWSPMGLGKLSWSANYMDQAEMPLCNHRLGSQQASGGGAGVRKGRGRNRAGSNGHRRRSRGGGRGRHDDRGSRGAREGRRRHKRDGPRRSGRPRPAGPPTTLPSRVPALPTPRSHHPAGTLADMRAKAARGPCLRGPAPISDPRPPFPCPRRPVSRWPPPLRGAENANERRPSPSACSSPPRPLRSHSWPPHTTHAPWTAGPTKTARWPTDTVSGRMRAAPGRRPRPHAAPARQGRPSPERGSGRMRATRTTPHHRVWSPPLATQQAAPVVVFAPKPSPTACPPPPDTVPAPTPP